MPTRRRVDRLAMDMTDDLERVDGVMGQILNDRGVWDEFLRDPTGVLVRLGLHPPTTPEVNERVNRAFYATLTNKRLLKLAVDHYKDFRASKKSRDQIMRGLRKGVIEHPIELDLEAAEHLLSSPDMLRRALSLTLYDLNSKGILERRRTRAELDAYVDKVVDAATARIPIDDHPTLETWDRNYGVGRRFGASVVEFATLVTAATVAEVGGVVTVVAVAAVSVDVVVDGTDPPTKTVLLRAAEGDAASIRALAILGRHLDLSGELLVHAHGFEAKPRS
jgi:hypothetical protein